MSDTPKAEPRRANFISSLCSSKKKLAPRSSLQFKIGPQFSQTIIENQVFTSTGDKLEPILTPRIDRGFERIDEEWVGYKRNYFTLVSAFQFQGVPFLKFASEYYYVIDPETKLKTRIKYFGIRLSSRCADDGSSVALVQHTAKRDRGPQFEPPTYPAVPSELPDHTIIREAANVRNTSKIAKLNGIFFFDKYTHNEVVDMSIKGLKDYPTDKIIKVARYERIQFSSSINYKKPCMNSKRFKLLVELVGISSSDTTIPLAYTETPPLIVRGRSPSNYQGSETEQIESQLQSSVQSTPSMDNLNDFDTYQILKFATENMDSVTSPLVTSLKKKRGRKPKPKIEGERSIISKRQKKLKDISNVTSSKPKIPCKKKINPITDNALDERFIDGQSLKKKKKNNNGEKVLKPQSLLSTPIQVTKRPQSISPNEFNEPHEFDDSMGLVNLFDLHMHYSSIPIKPSFPSLITSLPMGANSITGGSLESYESDFMLLKDRLELQKSNHHFYYEFDKMNPSAMLGVDDYEDGPSFMSYS